VTAAEYMAIVRLHEVAATSPDEALANNLSLVGHQGRRDGVTHADVDALVRTPESRAHTHSVLDYRLTPIAEAALRLACDHPEIADLPARSGRSLARRYLPARSEA
jgi:hypothetical protein